MGRKRACAQSEQQHAGPSGRTQASVLNTTLVEGNAGPGQMPQARPGASAKPPPSNNAIPAMSVATTGPSPVSKLAQMPQSSRTPQAVICAENIVMLHMISPVPERARVVTADSLNDAAHEARERTLTFEQESQLATALAFLSGISDEAEHITAVCIEELSAQTGCKVVVAINKLSPESSDDLLKQIRTGFEAIFRKLAKASTESGEGKRNPKEPLFNEIIAMCRERIIARLRLRNSKRCRKRYIGLSLREFLEAPWQRRAKARGSPMPLRHLEHLNDYKILAEQLLAHLEEFQSDFRAVEPKHERLASLVRHVARFLNKVPLREILACLTEEDIQSNARERLWSCLSKIARFRECATFLYGLARDIPILVNASVVAVGLPHAAFARSSQSATKFSVESVLARVMEDEDPRSLPAHLKKRAQINLTPNHFQSAVGRTLAESKFHAEVQILAYYEGMGEKVLCPRVIASSKDACCLCSTLIHLHGKFTVPKTHGVLYRGWRLPATKNFDSLQRLLNLHLEQKIRATIIEQSRLKGKPKTMYPNESTIFPLDISNSILRLSSSSTLASRAHARQIETLATVVEEVADQAALDNQYLFPSIERGRPTTGTVREVPPSVADSADSSSATMSATKAAVGDSVDDCTRESDCEDTVSDLRHAANASFGQGSLQETTPLPDKEKRPASITSPGPSVCDPAPAEAVSFRRGRFCYNEMEILLDSSSLGTTLRWLSIAESAEVLRGKADLVVDVLLLAAGTDTPFLRKDTNGVAYFAFGKQVVMVSPTGT